MKTETSHQAPDEMSATNDQTTPPSPITRTSPTHTTLSVSLCEHLDTNRYLPTNTLTMKLLILESSGTCLAPQGHTVNQYSPSVHATQRTARHTKHTITNTPINHNHTTQNGNRKRPRTAHYSTLERESIAGPHTNLRPLAPNAPKRTKTLHTQPLTPTPQEQHNYTTHTSRKRTIKQHQHKYTQRIAIRAQIQHTPTYQLPSTAPLP